MALGRLYKFYSGRGLQILIRVYSCVQTILLLSEPSILASFILVFNWTLVIQLRALVLMINIWLLLFFTVPDLASHWLFLELTNLGWDNSINFAMGSALAVWMLN